MGIDPADRSVTDGSEDASAWGGALTEAEIRFERLRQSIGLFLGPLVSLTLYLLPMRGLDSRAHILAAVIGWVIVWWITEPIPIPVTALLGASLCVLTGITNAKTALAPFADPIIFLFFGSFIIARAMAVQGLDKRFAYGILSWRVVGSSSGRILFVLGAVCAFMSMWISNTAATAMMLPIGIGVVSAMAEMMSRQTNKKVRAGRLQFSTGIMLMAAYASSTGGIGTPVGSPPNLIGLAMIEKFVQVKIPFFRWMQFAVPLVLIRYAFIFIILFLFHKPEVSRIKGSRDFIAGELRKLGPWKRGQKNALLAFMTAVILWVFPGFIAVFSGTESALSKAYSSRIPEAIAALLAVLLLFLLPVNWKKREFTITWRQAVQIDWGTLLLFGSGLTLGDLMFQTKLAEALGRSLLDIFGATSLWGLTLAGIYLAILVTETTSNTAAATMIVPVMISVSVAAGVNPLPPAIGATVGASLASMLPVSTPPNAIVYGSRMVPITRMLRAGVVLDVIGGLLVWAPLRILLPLLGLA